MNPTPAQTLWNVLDKMCKIGDDAGDLLVMKQMMTLAYYDLCAMFPFRSLRRDATLTFLATDTTGKWFPADMAGIYHAVDADGNKYLWRDVSNIRSDDENYRWYFSQTNTSALAQGSGINATIGSQTVGGITITAAQVGEWIHIGQDPGVYEITGTTEITPAYCGLEAAQSEFYQIRPQGTMKVAIYDTDTGHNGATVTFYYWAYPTPLTQPYHLVMLPTTEALLLKTAIRYWGDYKQEHDEADRFEVNYHRALTDLMHAEPRATGPIVPKDVQGRRLMFGRRR